MSDHRPIGIFDSGIGGLTVANSIATHLPSEQLIYFGDTAHLPYGDKAASSIIDYSRTIASFLLKKEVKAIVIACNTASSIATKAVQEVAGNVPVINVIDPVVNHVCKTDYNKIGVIGTRATILSNEYELRINTEKPNLEVFSLATPLLVPMIEEHIMDEEVGRLVIEKYLSQEILSDIEALILGCTHYPLIKDLVIEHYKGDVAVLDSADIVGRHVKHFVEENNLSSDSLVEPHHFYVSDFTISFEKNTRDFFRQDIHLEEYNLWASLKPGAV